MSTINLPTLRALAPFALAAGLFAAAAGPAAAAQSGHGATAAKPSPVPPAGVQVGHTNVAKPGSTGHTAIRPLTSWSVTLTASPTTLWPTQYSTLTATASQDVGPTPEYIYIYDEEAGAVVAKCGTGTTCSVALTHNTPYYGYFVAYISDGTDTTGARGLAYSPTGTVDWESVGLTLSSSANTLAVGASATLTSTSSQNVGPSPFWTEIWDTTTGTELAICGSGTTCSATVSQSVATTHSYVATLSSSSSTYPPANLQTTSPTEWVTWTNDGYVISLSAPAITVNGPETVTATTNVNVGPTPYYIEIFNENGTRIASCGSGTTCSVSYTPASGTGSNLVAFISSSSTAYPPTNIQASSNTVTSTYEFIG